MSREHFFSTQLTSTLNLTSPAHLLREERESFMRVRHTTIEEASLSGLDRAA